MLAGLQAEPQALKAGDKWRPWPQITSVIAKVKLEALDRGREMFNIVPRSALNPLRQNVPAP